MRWVVIALAALSTAPAVGCGSGGDDRERPRRGSVTQPEAGGEQSATGEQPAPRAPRLRCRPDASQCASAGGEIVYVEKVDPDGDGDAHFVLLSEESITGPGISVIDVARDLRPEPLPGPGDAISAIGPVQRGSYGQRQIEATEVRVAYE